MTISTILKFIFNSSIALLKLKPFDFQIKQNWFLYIYNAIFLSVILLGFILESSKQAIPKLCFVQQGWILACVITVDFRFSSRIKIKKSSVQSLPVKYLKHFIKQLANVGI